MATENIAHRARGEARSHGVLKPTRNARAMKQSNVAVRGRRGRRSGRY